MQQDITKCLFTLLRAAIGAGALTKAERAACRGVELKQLLQLAKKHDIMHLAVKVLSEEGLLAEGSRKAADRTLALAVYRYEHMKYEYERVSKALEEAKIPFLPLKGTILRDYYPEPWMRTSCDIDILVREDDLDAAIRTLVEDRGYTCGMKSAHDVELISEGDVHIELHYDLVEEGRAAGAYEVLSHVWEQITPDTGWKYRMVMSDELFYFYHLAHMAKHVEVGGCGIRPFLDLWILDQLPGADTEKRDALLEVGKLLQFATAARKLGDAWLFGKRADRMTEQMADFILCGGVYGTQQNRIAMQQQKSGGKLRYFLSRVFLPYDKLKFHYPILQKHRWLTPLMELRRWYSLLFGKQAGRAAAELRYNQNVDAAVAESTGQLLAYLGL